MKRSLITTIIISILVSTIRGQTSIQGANYTIVSAPSIFYNQVQANYSYAFYQMQTASSGFTVIRVDAEDQFSDPDIFVTTKYPLNLLDNTNSDQHCELAGSDVCILDPNIFAPNKLVFFMIKCYF